LESSLIKQNQRQERSIAFLEKIGGTRFWKYPCRFALRKKRITEMATPRESDWKNRPAIEEPLRSFGKTLAKKSGTFLGFRAVSKGNTTPASTKETNPSFR